MASLLWRLSGSVFVQKSLKERLSKGQSVCPVATRHEDPPPSSQQALAHSIIVEHLDGTAGLRYTLPVFLSETCHSCHSCRSALPFTAEILCEQLGISAHSPVGSFLTAHASDTRGGEQRSATIMLCMTCASNFSHSDACIS